MTSSKINLTENKSARSQAWEEIFKHYKIDEHNFEESPFMVDAKMIKKATSQFLFTGQREVRILCKQDTRESRPEVFKEKGLFILPVRNGKYFIIKGEGYIDIPEITSTEELYKSKLDFKPLASFIGDSEMQHLDYAYATSLVRTFMEDPSLVLVIRGRKYTSDFSFKVGGFSINARSVQTEVDAGYEGKDKVVLVEAKNSKTNNTIIRQLYYPFRQWQLVIGKPIKTLFFEKDKSNLLFWEFEFTEPEDYNSINLLKSKRYKIVDEKGI